MHTQTTTWLAAKLYLDFGFNILNKNEKNGWNILKTLTNHPKLNEFETLKIEEVYDKRNVEIEAQLNQIFKDDSFNYSVWYKNGLHNVYVYYKNSTYEYEYFDDEDKIILKEVENKKYKDMDLNDINPDDIPDINEIRIDRRKPKVERMLDFLSQVENPYVFKVNGHLVQIGFTNNGKTAEDCLTNVLKNLYR